MEARTKNLNIVYFLLRRKFIPPFYDSFIDISLTYTERVDNTESSTLLKTTHVMLENIADSFFANESLISPKDMENILEAKMDSLVLDSPSLNYFHTALNITSRDSYRLGLQFVFKLLTILEEFAKDFIGPIKINTGKKIEKEMKKSGAKDFNMKYL